MRRMEYVGGSGESLVPSIVLTGSINLYAKLFLTLACTTREILAVAELFGARSRARAVRKSQEPMAVDVLNGLLKVLGVLEAPLKLHHGSRGILLIMDILTIMYIVHVCSVVASVAPSNVMYAFYFTLTVDFVYCTLVYLWGIRYAKRNRIKSLDSRTRLWGIINLGLILMARHVSRAVPCAVLCETCW